MSDNDSPPKGIIPLFPAHYETLDILLANDPNSSPDIFSSIENVCLSDMLEDATEYPASPSSYQTNRATDSAMPEEFNSPFNPLNDDEYDDFWTLQFGDTEPTDDADTHMAILFGRPFDVPIEPMMVPIVPDLLDHEPQTTHGDQTRTFLATIFGDRSPTLRFTTQPPLHHRLRYLSDGVRYLISHHADPVAVELPALQGSLLEAGHSFWMRVTCVTTRNNPHSRLFAHTNELCYNEPTVVQYGPQSVLLQLSENDIRSQRKALARLSIYKIKLEKYSFRLIPCDPLDEDANEEIYTHPNGARISVIGKAKAFREAYGLNEFQIVCELMIKAGDQWIGTGIACESTVVTDGQ